MRRVVTDDRDKVVVVVGAGRSGTSTVTRGMQALGVRLGDRLKRATRKNPRGFFEDADILDINHRLRQTLGFRRSGAGVGVVPRDAFDDERLEPMFRKAVAIINSRFSGQGLWGFKSGATLSFLPFWERVFEETGQQAHYVLALRNPLAVAQSRRKVSARRGVQCVTDLEFLARVVPYLRRAAQRPFAVLEYDRLLDDPKAELAQAGWLLGLEPSETQDAALDAFASEFVSRGLRNHRFVAEDLDAAPDVLPLARHAYRLLATLARRDRIVINDGFWRSWEWIEYAHGSMTPALGHIDTLHATSQLRSFRVPRPLRMASRSLGQLGPVYRWRS